MSSPRLFCVHCATGSVEIAAYGLSLGNRVCPCRAVARPEDEGLRYIACSALMLSLPFDNLIPRYGQRAPAFFTYFHLMITVGVALCLRLRRTSYPTGNVGIEGLSHYIRHINTCQL